MFGYVFWLCSPFFCWGLWCVCLGWGSSRSLLCLAGVLRHVPSCVCLVSFPLTPGGAACGVGLCGGHRGRGFCPLLYFFFAVFSDAGGGDLWVWFSALSCCGSVVVATACLGLGSLGLRPPSPFRLGFFLFTLLVSASVWPLARDFSDGVCAGLSGVSFPLALRRPCGCGWPLLLAGCLRAGRGGPPVFYCLAGGVDCLLWCGCAASWLCDCLPRFPSFPLAGGCAFVDGWGFPRSVFFF